MRIKKKNVARLASLSALGAGALGVAAGTAKADVIYFNFGLPAVVGDPAIGVQTPSWQTALPGGSQHMGVSFSSAASHRAVKAWGSNGVKFGLGAYFSARPFNFLNIVASGATWGGNPSSGVNAVIASRQGVSFANGALGGNFTDMYALFQFSNVGSPTGFLYGWLELSSFVAPSGTNTTGPRVTVEGWAYDTTGTPIAAGAGNLGGGGNGGPVCGSVGDDHEGGEGDDNGCSVPEPSTAVMFGFAAMALGATGLRRWRAARQPAA